jgi:hypothetical protein
VIPRLKFGPRVTRKHGEEFAEAWRERQSGEIVSEGFGGLGLIEWPEEDPNRPLGQIRQDPRQARYHDITDEIAEQTFDAVMPFIAEAFVKYARKVLARERRRQRQGSIIGQ